MGVLDLQGPAPYIHGAAPSPAVSDPLKLLLDEHFTRLTRRYLRLAGAGKITPAEYLLLAAVADKTVSYKRPFWAFSIADLTRTTGLSHQGVKNAVASLIGADLLSRKPKGQSYSYGIVPEGMTADEFLAFYETPKAAVETVDNVGAPGNSVAGGVATQLLGSERPSSMYSFKKGIKKGSARVDKGVQGKADPTCPECHGEGWLFYDEADGHPSSASPCVCTGVTL